MKIFQKAVMLSVFCVLFSCETEESITEMETKSTAKTEKTSEVRFDVYIQLEDWQTGQSVPANTLPGYSATNIVTGATFYDSMYEVGLFENLPVGTYRFDARDGYFDGASSAIVEVIPANETPDGWIIATLKYWSE